MSQRINIRRAIVAAAAALALPLPSVAQDKPWPQARPITWIVGQPPGGTADIVTRLIARKLGEATSQTVLVDNRPGASGVIGMQAAAKAAPDGYTLLTASGPSLYGPQAPVLGRDLIPVAIMAQGPMVLVAPASNKALTLAELLAQMHKTPDEWSYATSGTGSSQHIAGELFNSMAGTRMTHIPYKGGSQATTDVIGGQAKLGILGVAPVIAHIKSGKLKAYAVTTTFRLDSLPDVPTMQEAGLKGFDASQWEVLAVPKGTPVDIINQINSLVNRISQMPEVKNTLLERGSNPGTSDARTTQTFLEADRLKWLDVAQKAKIVLD